MYISLQEFSIIPHTVFLTPPVFEIGNEDLVLDEQIKPKQLEVGMPKCNSVGNFDLTLDQTTNQSTQSKKYDQDLGSIIDGQERHIRQLLEQKRLELSAPIIPGTLILIELGMKTKKAKSNDNWTPVGNLIAHFAEHQSTINSIKMSNDHSFFVSCSDDQKVKIWDTQRLKTNVTNRAKVTFDAKSAVKDVCFIQGRDSIVSCSADGKIHINRYLILIRVEYIKNQKGMTKYSPVKSVKTIQLVDDYATKVEHFDRDYSSLIVYATKNGQLSAVDLRCMKEAWTFNIPPHHGIITSMCVDANNNWISTGTHRGVVSLFDVRFQLNTNAWQHISRKPITHMETFCKGKIAMSVENFVKETSIWDLKSGKCEQVWCSKNTESGNELEEFYEDGLKPIMPLTSSQMLLEKPRKDFTKRTEKTFFAVCDRMKFMISGADRRLRFNDLLQPEKSFVFAGDSSPVFQTFKNHDVVFNVEQRSESFGQNFGRVSRKDEALLDVSGDHEDIITSVVIAKSPFCMVISGARDGVINVYQ
jgi:phosphoinositide-3-kinase regulatory subunit 4